METKNSLLERLAAIREHENYTRADVEFILNHMQVEDEAVRAAAILTGKGCLHEPEVIDAYMDAYQRESHPAVMLAIIQALGDFISAGYAEGFETELEQVQLPEDEEDFEQIQLHLLLDRYREVREMLFSFLTEEEPEHPHYLPTLAALRVLGGQDFLQERLRWVMDSMPVNNPESVLQILELHPDVYPDILEQLLKSDLSDDQLQWAIRIAGDSRLAELIIPLEPFLNDSRPEIVKSTLEALTMINRSENLEQLLQQYCLHEHETVQQAARKCLDILSAGNFNDYMGQFFYEQLDE